MWRFGWKANLRGSRRRDICLIKCSILIISRYFMAIDVHIPDPTKSKRRKAHGKTKTPNLPNKESNSETNQRQLNGLSETVATMSTMMFSDV